MSVDAVHVFIVQSMSFPLICTTASPNICHILVSILLHIPNLIFNYDTSLERSI